jgi:hypothetical protein
LTLLSEPEAGKEVSTFLSGGDTSALVGFLSLTRLLSDWTVAPPLKPHEKKHTAAINESA